MAGWALGLLAGLGVVGLPAVGFVVRLAAVGVEV